MKLQKPDPRPRPLDHLTLLGDAAAPALTTREGALDFAGLEDSVGRLAAALRAREFAPGARVASWLPKNRMTSLLPLAAARAGLVHVPVNPLLKRMQVAHILADSGASLLVSGQARLATLEPGKVERALARRQRRRVGRAAQGQMVDRSGRRVGGLHWGSLMAPM